VSEDGEIFFDPASYEEGASRIGAAADDMGLAGESYASVQGQASAQLRQWGPTVPVAETLDQVEAKLAEATQLGSKDLRYTSDNLLASRDTMLETEGRNTALAQRAAQDLRQSDLADGSGTGTADGGEPNRIERLLNGNDTGAAQEPSAENTPAEPLSPKQRYKINSAIDRTLQRVNPKYDRAQTEYSENCTGVVQANELRRRGIPVEAGPLERPLRSDEGGPGGRSAAAIEKPWGGKLTSATKAETEKAFEEPGSRGVVAIQWNRGGGHVFNVENVDGDVRFLDGQPTPPVTDASYYFGRGHSTAYIRLDNRPTPPADATKPYLEP
jgi:hypothetical protein